MNRKRFRIAIILTVIFLIIYLIFQGTIKADLYLSKTTINNFNYKIRLSYKIWAYDPCNVRIGKTRISNWIYIKNLTSVINAENIVMTYDHSGKIIDYALQKGLKGNIEVLDGNRIKINLLVPFWRADLNYYEYHKYKHNGIYKILNE
jgi:hypothetical protein